MKELYIDKDELISFLNSSDCHLNGNSYEWEGEDVVHVHISPIIHAFGYESVAHWHKRSLPKEITDENKYHIVVNSENDVKAFFITNSLQI